MDILEAVQKDFVIIDEMAGTFLGKLPGDDIKKDLMATAELVGLILLRESNADLSNLEPGGVVLGAIDDETYQLIHRFLFGCAHSAGLDPRALFEGDLPEDINVYFPEITEYEKHLNSLCKKNNVKPEYYSFIAACAAILIILAGKEQNILDPDLGLAMTMYHINAGSKTVPYD
jgi:hypothetical protein